MSKELLVRARNFIVSNDALFDDASELIADIDAHLAQPEAAETGRKIVECDHCGAPCTMEPSGITSGTLNADGTYTDHGRVLVQTYAARAQEPVAHFLFDGATWHQAAKEFIGQSDIVPLFAAPPAWIPSERYEDALEKISQWCETYPLDIFPEPDLKRAHEVLTANGMTLDSISAHVSRHVLRGIEKIVRDALTPPGGKEGGNG